MLKNPYVRIGLVLAVVLAGVMVFAPTDQRLGISVSILTMVGVILGGQWPPLAGAILRHPRGTVAVGVAFAVFGTGAALVMGYGANGMDQMEVGSVVTVAGIALAVLPRSLKAVAEAKDKGSTAAPGDHRAARLPFGGGPETFRLLLREKVPLAVVVGPWSLVFLAPFAALILLTLQDQAAVKRIVGHIGAVAVLLVLLGAIVLVVSSMTVAAIQWTRFLATRAVPRLLDLPRRALWGFTWRFVLFGSVLRIPDQFGPWLTSHAPSLAYWASSGLTSLVGLAFLVLMSPWAMILPAIALDRHDRTSTQALQAARRVGRSYYLGSLVVLAPFAVIGWLLGLFTPSHGDQIQSLLILAIWTLALFFTIAAAMTFLTEIYLRWEGARATSNPLGSMLSSG